MIRWFDDDDDDGDDDGGGDDDDDDDDDDCTFPTYTLWFGRALVLADSIIYSVKHRQTLYKLIPLQLP